MSIDHSCVEQEVEDPEPLSLRSPAYTVATCLLIKAIHSTHACSVLCNQPRTVYHFDGSIFLSSIYRNDISSSKCSRQNICFVSIHCAYTKLSRLLQFVSPCSFFDFCFARSGSPTICTHCSSWIYFLCCEVFHQARRWEEVVKCHMHCFELELLTKPFHHTSTKPDFNLIVVLFPNIYISNWNTYPADESARTHALYPRLMGFIGIYCFSEDLPLNSIIASSIDCELVATHWRWNSWLSLSIKGRNLYSLSYPFSPRLGALLLSFTWKAAKFSWSAWLSMC